jgi:ABC-type branched-subunit amino acid transport system permease subunit
VFCVSAFFAAVAGALFASFTGTVGGISFPSFLSLLLVVVLAIAGRGEVLAPVAAAVALHLVPSYINNAAINDWLPVLFGLGAINVAVLSNPRLDLGARLRAFNARTRPRRAASRISIRARPAVPEAGR